MSSTDLRSAHVPAAASSAEPAAEKSVQVAAVPLVIDPAAWEDFAVFWETFLVYLTPPDYAATLRKVGEMLFTMILEGYDPRPGWPESSMRTELRAQLVQ